jgi:NADPH-dependent glutamate synthase beta subunit-like oxidoreductase
MKKKLVCCLTTVMVSVAFAGDLYVSMDGIHAVEGSDLGWGTYVTDDGARHDAYTNLQQADYAAANNDTVWVENGFVCGMKCVEMELGEPDASGRRRPIVKEGSEFVLDVDCVIMSIGTSPNPLIRNTTKGLETNKHGCFIADENGLTSREGVYAGGDAVTGAATVILAMGAGKTAAKAMDEYIRSK